MSGTYDLVKVEQLYSNSIISIFNILNNKNEANIGIVKDLIKESLNNPESYVDYEESKYEILTSLLSAIMAYDTERFVFLFITSSFLLESIMKISENSSKSTDVSIELENLVNNFCNLIN